MRYLLTVYLLVFAVTAARAADLVTLTPQQVRQVQDGVLATLKDPDSARFDHIMAAQATSDGMLTVCGLVNAKNGFGGYSGNMPFVGFLVEKGFLLMNLSSNDTEAYATVSVCRDRGLVF